MNWQPIETAPKDGTRILLGRGDRVWLDEWWKGIGISGWASLVAWEQAGGSYSLPPTHWMPLPDPPSTERTVAQLEVG